MVSENQYLIQPRGKSFALRLAIPKILRGRFKSSTGGNLTHIVEGLGTDTEGAYTLAVEKRNNGPKGQPITLHWNDGVLLPRSEVDTAQQSSLFLDACVNVVRMSAENGAPITRQKNLDGWQIDEIENGAGYRPSPREINEQLARALGLGRLRYIKGYGKQQPGYFPIEIDPALHRQTGTDSAHEGRLGT